MASSDGSSGKMRFILMALVLVVVLARYMGGNKPTPPVAGHITPAAGEWYKPAASVPWQIQLQGEVNTEYPAELYDIDLFDTPISLIKRLHSSGKRVICYFSAGSSEDWRQDYKKFADEDKGSPLPGWPGERWLNVRSDSIREIMKARMDMAKEKGCDGVDPDNVDSYKNNPGFNVTSEDQLAYNKFLAEEAHKRGLAVSLKNDLDQADELADFFDFSVNEQCFQYDECDKLRSFIAKNKPVLNIEYNKTTSQDDLCRKSRFLKFSTLIMPLKLDDSSRVSCLEQQP